MGCAAESIRSFALTGLLRAFDRFAKTRNSYDGTRCSMDARSPERGSPSTSDVVATRHPSLRKSQDRWTQTYSPDLNKI